MRLPLLSGLRRDRVLRPGDLAWNCGRPGGRIRGSFLPCADEVGLGGAATFVAAASRRHRTRELNRRRGHAPGPALLNDARYRTSVVAVKDSFYVVPIRVEHERAVVARVVDRALARRAVVLVARRERGGVERAHRGVLARGEREVDVLGEWPLVPDEREAVVRAGQLRAAGLVLRQAKPGMRGDRRVEAPGGLRVADAEPQVVDAAGGHGAWGSKTRPGETRGLLRRR